ncbi:hypothetical protein KR044_007597 [Drosophila immigrans]|nr:hypothetical protein KR044_007597 [Drosophila immigrans]
MIPTSVTNSPPVSAGLAQNGAAVVGGGNGAGGAATVAATTAAAAAAAAQQSIYSSIVLGLASLILEGRPIADDEYQQQLQSQQQLMMTAGSGRLSPRPSTSRAAINITTNPYALTSGTPRTTFGGSNSGGSGSSSSQATHQRWTQKLCQLRQLSPAAQSMSVEPELVALAINELNAERGDFEIVRRVMLNRAGGAAGLASGLGGGGSGGAVPAALGTATNSSSAASSPGSASDNILHSLQSLATTCLRGGPVLPAEQRPLSLTLASTSSAASLLDYNSIRTAAAATGAGGIVAPGLGLSATATAIATATATTTATTTATASSDAAGSSCAARPKHGPHCDQFLRKMGLAKGDAADAEEHFCDMSYVNITCSRWRAYCLKMEAILARREPVCIEVYLGPAGHKILLEQWIISAKEKVPPPTMTLPSLCSAIRSQLYFSQIVAWCDLLRKCDPSVYDSGRVIFSSCSASNAGDLATSGSVAATTTTALGAGRRPRLNIFYRIRAHDPSASGQNDGGFSAKATVHNFPHVNIAENFSVAVCVKSLPRFNGGLPHVATPPPPAAVASRARPEATATTATAATTSTASTPTGGGGMCAATPTGLGARIANSNATRSSCDKSGGKQRHPLHTVLQWKRERAELQLQLELDDAEAGAEDRDELDGHRERQLQKYRKRMQRRDKKRDRKPSDQQVEAMDEGSSSEVAMVMTLAAAPRRQGIAMISTGTQTSLSSCQQCGSEKTLLCLNCNCTGRHDDNSDDDADGDENGHDDGDTSASEMDDLSSCSLSSSDLIVGTPRNKAELLLQAIQRTPKIGRKPNASKDLKVGRQQAPSLLPCASNPVQQQQQNNNQQKPTTAPSSGCQVCKRQKTQHNFSNGQQSARESNGHVSDTNSNSNSSNSVEQQQQSSSTKLTPNLERCSLNGSQERCRTPPELAANGAGGGGAAAELVDERLVVQFKTPISHVPLKQQELQSATFTVQSPKLPNQLRLNCSGATLLDRETPPPMLSPLLRKALPKVNLTTIFCGGSSSSSSSSAPIAIDNSIAFCFEPSTLSQAQSQTLLTPPETGNLPVQKSYSAPTLPNALAVSPRFAKQAAFYKRRSRHLSDRSDRSSLGSDEQLSDEDLESGMCSPAGSPLKSRARLATQFSGRPLLGNLEESLLQKRLLPKIEVAGFRLQLGASGGFCPTQLTIPASSYFYELHGETLSTPYLCEIRLPRKGYFVPRSGTVQATLLNPMGTVVRMFVIPYDMHDMPPLHRTFIRQRVLAEELAGASPCGTASSLNLLPQREREPGSPTAATSTTSKLGHFISADQMKRLRYSIHLRFQTSRSGRLSLHTDIRLLISRRTDCDTAAAHAKGLLEAPNELVTDTLMPTEPRYSSRQESPGKI